ncbi:MAG: SOS response-associated peptidase [Cohaesibacteraceae bacterium]
MCGRFVLRVSKPAFETLFDVSVEGPYLPRFNITPTQPVLTVHELTGPRRMEKVRWGLIPHWHKAPQTAQLLINARIETALEKPSFRAAVNHKRCLVPATHFYEWKREGSHRQPFAVARKEPDGEEGLFAFAGLLDDWTGKDGEVMTTLAILTQQADGAIADIHHRMPVVVPTAHYGDWLNVRSVTAGEALDPLRTPTTDAWRPWPVDPAVNKAGADGPELLREVEPVKPEPKAQLDLF